MRGGVQRAHPRSEPKVALPAALPDRAWRVPRGHQGKAQFTARQVATHI